MLFVKLLVLLEWCFQENDCLKKESLVWNRFYLVEVKMMKELVVLYLEYVYLAYVGYFYL